MHDTYFFTDIHGQLHLYNYIINYCKAQDEGCTIVYGGDACDRGPDGFKIMNDLLQDPQIIYLKGNHEDLFVKAARSIYQFIQSENVSLNDFISKSFAEDIILSTYTQSVLLYLRNGGMPTLQDWIINSKCDMHFVNQIDNLPYTYRYNNYDICHSGSTPEDFAAVEKYEYKNARKRIPSYLKEAILWDRDHLADEWSENRTAIFGHTPTILLNKNFPKQTEATITPSKWNLYKTHNGNKLDMDTGATWTGRAFVANLTTGNIIGIQDYDINTKETNHRIQFISDFSMNINE